MARRSNRYRNAALAGGAVGIGLGLASIGRVPYVSTPWGIAGLAVAGMVVGAVAGGARSSGDLKKALLQPAS